MTTTKTTISMSDARKRFFEIADEVQTPNRVYTLTADGKPKVVLMSAEEYESWTETMEVERIFPNLREDIKETEEAIKSGEYKKWLTLEGLEKKWGLSRAPIKGVKKKNGIRTLHKTKSGKSTR